MSMWLPEIPTLTRRSLLKVGAVAISGFDLLPMLRPLNATAKEKVPETMTPYASRRVCSSVKKIAATKSSSMPI